MINILLDEEYLLKYLHIYGSYCVVTMNLKKECIVWCGGAWAGLCSAGRTGGDSAASCCAGGR